ncbi:MAG: hypothetical protein LBP89_00050, partial [Helicobacteraceae bacterium]|nr:hypothetical protein [Helicobacteraceae bacterium]
KACKHDQYGGVCTRAKILNAVAEVNGDGITVAVLTKSCDEKKNWFSCSVLAGMYWNGKAFYDDFIPSETAPKDLYKAHEYFAKGCAINKDREISVSCSYAKKTLDEIKAQETNASKQ